MMNRSQLLRLIFVNNHNTGGDGGYRADWRLLSVDEIDNDDDLEAMDADRDAMGAPAVEGTTADEEDTFGAGFNIDAGKRKIDGVPDEVSKAETHSAFRAEEAGRHRPTASSHAHCP